jgi:hypothetical protein
MANWTKTGFIGQMFALVSRFIAPPGMPAPVLCGDESTVRVRRGSAAADADLVALWSAQNQSGDANRTVVYAKHLHVVAIRMKQ